MQKLLFGALLALSFSAQAQTTLGDLIDGGARKLARHEVQAAGTLRVMKRTPDTDAFIALHPDGTAVGVVHNKQGHGSSEALGTWTIDDSGRHCWDIALPAFGMTMKQCSFTYRLGNDLYAAASDSDRAAPALAYAAPAFLTK